MVSVSRKKIKGKYYAYMNRSFRLPDGKVVTISKRLGKTDESKNLKLIEKKYMEFMIEKECEIAGNWAANKYRTNYVFSQDAIRKLEKIRINYNYLLKKMDKTRKKDIFDRFTANFTYDSNAIEGSSLTLKDVSIIIFDKETVTGKPLREIYETRNSRQVTDLILKKKFKISHSDIIRLHRILMKDIDSRKGYKKIPNIIFRSDKEVHTTLPENVRKEMTDLINWCNASKMHPLETASVFHGRFEKIHPFEDGNGRVGRFLINVILINKGYPPIIVRKTSRQAYMSSLLAFDSGYEDKLKNFLLNRFKDTFGKFFEIYVKYA
jgi:Fic family protein